MSVMEALAKGWNAGSLDRFIAIYADDTTFVTESGRSARARMEIAANYAASFIEGANSRGKLNFA